MTDGEAIQILEINKPVIKRMSISARRYIEAFNMAIKALEQKSKYQADTRRFKRKYLLLKHEYEALKAEQEPNTNYRAFAEWVASEIFSENWEDNKGAFSELACRRLEKLEIVKTDGDKWKLKEG